MDTQRPQSRNIDEVEIYEIFREQAIALSRSMDTGRIRYEEIAAIVEKINLVRNLDDGFGRVIIDLTRRNNKDEMKIRTVLDKIVKPLQIEKDLL